MKNINLLLNIFLVLVLAGCSTIDKEHPDGEGYVFEISKDRVLILNNVDPKEIGREWNEIFDSYQGEAIWLSTKGSKLKVGQYVRYWIDGGVDDSFPSQASSKKIEIIRE